MKNKSAEEGTLVHELAEGILAGQSPVIPDSYAALMDAFHVFLQQHDIVPRSIERKIISHKHGYAGTIDVLAEVDGKIGVLDIKTSQAIYRDYGIQTAAYVEALHEEENMPSLTRWILRLDQARLCMNGCGARMRDKGGTEKIKNGYGYKARSCSHVWGASVGDVELKELPDLAHDTQAFLASKTLWEWEHHDWLRHLPRINADNSLPESTPPL
ncbi:MAG: hypothetical protein AAB420_02310 [Patescibacteria group bacterium]